MNKKEKIQRISMRFQMESCKVDYSLYSKEYCLNYPLADNIIIDCKAITSDYRSIKVGDIVTFNFMIQKSTIQDDYQPEAYGEFRKIDKKRHCYIVVPPCFPARLDFILNRGIKPYFYVNCVLENRGKPVVKNFQMESENIYLN